LLGNGNGTLQAPIDMPSNVTPNDVVLADLDHDRALDLVVVDTVQTVSILRGSGHGTWSTPTMFPAGMSTAHVAVADLDRDGNLDVVISAGGFGVGPGLVVFLGNGDGTLRAPQAYVTGIGPEGLALGDVDGDGVVDVVVANFNANTISVLTGVGDGSLRPKRDFAAGQEPNSIALVDLDGDGRLDVVATDGGDDTVTVLHNACLP
jgi:hypothetical protein